MENREDGWYWVKSTKGGPWHVARWFAGSKTWMTSGDVDRYSDYSFELIGPRVTTPDPREPRRVTLDDVVRVLAEINKKNGMARCMELFPDGSGSIAQVKDFDSMDKLEELIRKAIDFLDNKPTKTVMDVLKEG